MKTRERRYTSCVLVRRKNIADQVSYEVVCEVDSGTDANKKAVELAAQNPGASYVAANMWPAIMAKEIKRVIFVDPDNPNDAGKDNVEIDEEEDNNGGSDAKNVVPSVPVAVKPEPVKPEPVKPESVKPEPVKSEPVKPEPVKSEPVKKETTKAETPKAETKVKKKDADSTSKKDDVKSSGGDDSFLSLFSENGEKKGEDSKKDEEPAGFVNKDEENGDENEGDDSKTTIPSLF